jgi:hypothetical protein
MFAISASGTSPRISSKDLSYRCSELSKSLILFKLNWLWIKNCSLSSGVNWLLIHYKSLKWSIVNSLISHAVAENSEIILPNC